MNEVRRSTESWSHLYFTMFSFTISFQKQQEKFNLPFKEDLLLE